MSLPHNSNLSSLKLYNPQLIHKMCRGDEEKIAKMMEVFIDQTSEAMQEIRDSYSEKDFLRIAKLVHKIKPTLTYFGTAALEKEFYYLEDLILNKSEQSEIELKIENVNILFIKVVDEMKNDFNIN